MSKQEAITKAIQLAITKLSEVELKSRCERLGFSPAEGDEIYLRIFGSEMVLNIKDFSLTYVSDSLERKPAKPNDKLLLLHYLLCEVPIIETNELISFRNLRSGQFYRQPFLSRTINPLTKRIGNDVELLKNNLNRFDWEEINLGDFAAKIHAFGNIFITLVYHYGDKEFPPNFSVFFDKSIIHAFSSTEDVVVLASRICIGLL